MGKPASKLQDMNSGESCFPPSSCNSGSGNVFTNGKPAMKVGSTFVPHACPKPGPHTPVLAKGSSTVFINSVGAGRIGDMTGCGASVITGSSNVFIGG